MAKWRPKVRAKVVENWGLPAADIARPTSRRARTSGNQTSRI